VKIDSAAAHFHGFGVARQGPWVTWVNKGMKKGRSSYAPAPDPRRPALTARAEEELEAAIDRLEQHLTREELARVLEILVGEEEESGRANGASSHNTAMRMASEGQSRVRQG
jgi:hypothetical protein